MFIFKPELIPAQVFLVGAGGTGSRLVPMLAQLIRTCIRKYNPTAWMDSLPLYIIDDDVVEEKNLLRQNFIQRDVGQPKAAVLASRYSAAFGIPIYSSVSRIGKKVGQTGQFTTLKFPNAPTGGIGTNFLISSIVILAVDSAEARREILSAISCTLTTNSNIFVIDAGNEDDFGQIKFFTMRRGYLDSYAMKDVGTRLPRQSPVSLDVNYIPIDFNYYSNLGSSAQELSCAELPQTLAINSMMATLILSVVQNLLYLKPMNYDGIRFGLNGSVSTEYNTAARWMERSIPDTNSHLHSSIQLVHQDLISRLHAAPLRDDMYTLIDLTNKFCKKHNLMVKDRELVPIPQVIPATAPKLVAEPIPEPAKRVRKKPGMIPENAITGIEL